MRPDAVENNKSKQLSGGPSVDVAECGVNEMAEAHSHALLTEWGGEGVVSNLHSRSQVDRMFRPHTPSSAVVVSTLQIAHNPPPIQSSLVSLPPLSK